MKTLNIFLSGLFILSLNHMSFAQEADQAQNNNLNETEETHKILERLEIKIFECRREKEQALCDLIENNQETRDKVHHYIQACEEYHQLVALREHLLNRLLQIQINDLKKQIEQMKKEIQPTEDK